MAGSSKKVNTTSPPSRLPDRHVRVFPWIHVAKRIVLDHVFDKVMTIINKELVVPSSELSFSLDDFPFVATDATLEVLRLSAANYLLQRPVDLRTPNSAASASRPEFPSPTGEYTSTHSMPASLFNSVGFGLYSTIDEVPEAYAEALARAVAKQFNADFVYLDTKAIHYRQYTLFQSIDPDTAFFLRQLCNLRRLEFDSAFLPSDLAPQVLNHFAPNTANTESKDTDGTNSTSSTPSVELKAALDKLTAEILAALQKALKDSTWSSLVDNTSMMNESTLKELKDTIAAKHNSADAPQAVETLGWLADALAAPRPNAQPFGGANSNGAFPQRELKRTDASGQLAREIVAILRRHSGPGSPLATLLAFEASKLSRAVEGARLKAVEKPGSAGTAGVAKKSPVKATVPPAKKTMPKTTAASKNATKAPSATGKKVTKTTASADAKLAATISEANESTAQTLAGLPEGTKANTMVLQSPSDPAVKIVIKQFDIPVANGGLARTDEARDLPGPRADDAPESEDPNEETDSEASERRVVEATERFLDSNSGVLTLEDLAEFVESAAKASNREQDRASGAAANTADPSDSKPNLSLANLWASVVRSLIHSAASNPTAKPKVVFIKDARLLKPEFFEYLHAVRLCYKFPLPLLFVAHVVLPPEKPKNPAGSQRNDKFASPFYGDDEDDSREERRMQAEAQYWRSPDALNVFALSVDIPPLAKDPLEKPYGPTWFAQSEVLRKFGFARENASKVLQWIEDIKLKSETTTGGREQLIALPKTANAVRWTAPPVLSAASEFVGRLGPVGLEAINKRRLSPTEIAQLATWTLSRAFIRSNDSKEPVTATVEDLDHALLLQALHKGNLLLSPAHKIKTLLNPTGAVEASVAATQTADSTATPAVVKASPAIPLAKPNPTSSLKNKLDTINSTLNEFEKQLISSVVDPATIHTTFHDIGALEETKKKLESLFTPFRLRSLFENSHSTPLIKVPSGVLLYGPPGTGKTMLCRAMAKQASSTLLHISASNIHEMWFGNSERNVAAVFSLAKKLSPSIIFVDEADAILGTREAGRGTSPDIPVKTEFMAQWDGMLSNNDNRSVVIICATNRPYALDPAVLRRLPHRILVDLPDLQARKSILHKLLKDVNLDPASIPPSSTLVPTDAKAEASPVDPKDDFIARLAARSENYSGSDLYNVCLSAAQSIVADIINDKSYDPDASTEELAAMARKHVERPLSWADFNKAMGEIKPSVNEDATLQHLRQWQKTFGENKTINIGF